MANVVDFITEEVVEEISEATIEEGSVEIEEEEEAASVVIEDEASVGAVVVGHREGAPKVARRLLLNLIGTKVFFLPEVTKMEYLHAI